MNLPLQITTRGLEPSPTLERIVQQQARGLERFDSQIIACRVIVERPHHHHRRGSHVHVRIDITVPGHEIVVTREDHHDDRGMHAANAVREAFRIARRRLQDTLGRRRERPHPTPEEPALARVIERTDDHGFLLTPDGREIYFHHNAVLGSWDALAIGDPVRFVEEDGVEGPQASTVVPVRGGFSAARRAESRRDRRAAAPP